MPALQGLPPRSALARDDPKEPEKALENPPRSETFHFPARYPERRSGWTSAATTSPISRRLASACITLRENESCDVGVECRRCGEHGFAIATVDGIKWNDDD
jgi:hypothetical protein